MGEIKHEWSGTVLTVTSDSGVSSADLKGEKGDKGCRGPQGPAGVIVDSLGNIIWPGYATEQYVEDLIADIQPDMTGYATEEFVKLKIAQAQIPEAEVDLSMFALKSELLTKAQIVDIIDETLGVIVNGSY